MTALILIVLLAAAVALAFLLGLRIGMRELPAEEAIAIGLSSHWVWAATEIRWRRCAGCIFWVKPVRLRYD